MAHHYLKRACIRSFAAASLLIAFSTMASAQATPPSAAVLGPSDFVAASMQVVATIDKFDMGTVWDKSSAVMRQRVPKEQFIATAAQSRAQLGSVRTRDWTAVQRVLVTQAGGQLPPGQYMTVRLLTVGQNASKEEVVSFHLDSDGQWRLAGYALQ